MAKISLSLGGGVRVVVQVARYVGRSLSRRYHKRKVKIHKIKYGVPVISVVCQRVAHRKDIYKMVSLTEKNFHERINLYRNIGGELLRF